MTLFLENPAPIIFAGIVLEAMLATAFVSTRRGSVLLAMLGVLVLVLGGVALERLVVTDAERVEATLDGAAAALEANSLQQLEPYLARNAAETRGRAAYALGAVEITGVRISHLEIDINRLTSPPTAEARFHGVVNYQDRTGMIPYRTYAAQFVVGLELEDDRWVITDHIEYQELR